jgi:hypothetical protein
MLLDSKNIPEIQRLLDAGTPAAFEKIRDAETTLTTSLFLALAHRSFLNSGDGQLARNIAQLGLPGIQRGIDCLDSARRISPNAFRSPSFDLYRIGSKEDLLNHEWILFYERFRRTAANGRKGNMFRGVAGVLGEMGDNVVCHAFEAEDKPCPALAGFHIAGDVASFCVADCGQGFLRSLRRSPSWAGLTSDSDALDAVVNKHATSRPGEATGGGFRQLFNSLLDFNGLVILRSGGCSYQLQNTGTGVRRQTSREFKHVTGSAITVIISPRQQPGEVPLKDSI